MNKKELIDKIRKNGMSFDQFNKQADSYVLNADESLMDEDEKRLLDFTKLNQRRTYRILKTYKASDKIKDAIREIDKPQLWMVLTEDWCGDSAQNLPYLYKMTLLNDNIELLILYRDNNLDIMDMYLINNGRAIPKIVGFDKNGNELFQWGPRPEEAKQLIAKWKSEGDTKEQFLEKLHLWYGKNKGKAFEDDMLKIINNSVA